MLSIGYRTKIVTLSSILFLTLATCDGTSKKVGEYHCSELIETIYGKESLQFRPNDFSNYDIDKQYALFICGNQYVHPPMTYLAELFAKEGDKVVDFLKGKLVVAKDDLTIRDLVLVFAEMTRLRTYDVAKDERLMHLISERLEGMKDPEWRRITEEMAARIKK